MVSSKRFRSFFFGIVFASFTWTVILYLYWTLNQTEDTRNTIRRPTLASMVQKSNFMLNDILIPYEMDEKKIKRSKSKYLAFDNKYKNSDSLKKHLKPERIQPLLDIDKGKLM